MKQCANMCSTPAHNSWGWGALLTSPTLTATCTQQPFPQGFLQNMVCKPQGFLDPPQYSTSKNRPMILKLLFEKGRTIFGSQWLWKWLLCSEAGGAPWSQWFLLLCPGSYKMSTQLSFEATRNSFIPHVFVGPPPHS